MRSRALPEGFDMARAMRSPLHGSRSQAAASTQEPIAEPHGGHTYSEPLQGPSIPGNLPYTAAAGSHASPFSTTPSFLPYSSPSSLSMSGDVSPTSPGLETTSHLGVLQRPAFAPWLPQPMPAMGASHDPALHSPPARRDHLPSARRAGLEPAGNNSFRSSWDGSSMPRQPGRSGPDAVDAPVIGPPSVSGAHAADNHADREFPRPPNTLCTWRRHRGSSLTHRQARST